MKRLSYLFGAAGLVALAYCAIEFGEGLLFQAREAERVRAPLVTKAEGPKVAPRLPAGSPVAKLMIPSLALSATILEGAGQRELKLGPGHISGTALPGKGGNFAVAGHRDTFFRPLRHIHTEDVIEVTVDEHTYLYHVVSTEIVNPDDIHSLYPAGHDTLTLVTCYPFYFIGPAPRRFIVRADCTNCADTK
jgi:sortase A